MRLQKPSCEKGCRTYVGPKKTWLGYVHGHVFEKYLMLDWEGRNPWNEKSYCVCTQSWKMA